MKKIKLMLIALLVAVAISASAQSSSVKYYCNARFGYCITYDASILKPMPEAYNGDGRVFKDAKDKTILTVSGSGDWNFGNDGEVIPLAALYRKELKEYGADITYKLLGKSFFIISGKVKGKIFYQKTVKRTDAFCTASLSYDTEDADKYKASAALIAKDFQ